MPKAFTYLELEQLDNRLLQAGREQLARFGYKKFGIRDVVEAVGVSTGSFYKLYASKEDFVIRVLTVEKAQVRQCIHDQLMRYKDRPVQALRSFYRVVVEAIYQNPLMNALLLQDDYNALLTQLAPQELMEERHQSIEPLIEMVDYWKASEYIRDVDAALLIHSVRSLVFLHFHQAEIGADVFEDVMGFLLDRICEYVVPGCLGE